MNQKLLGLGDVSKLIGVPKHRIEYGLSNGSIPEPKIRISNKRVFTTEDIQRIADYFGVTIKGKEES